MFLSSDKKNNVCPCKPQFYYINAGFKGSELYRHVFAMRPKSTSASAQCDQILLSWHGKKLFLGYQNAYSEDSDLSGRTCPNVYFLTLQFT